MPLELPPLMTSTSGTPILTPEAWRTLRRPELLELFRHYVFGRNPIDRPPNLTFTVTDESPAMDGQALRKQITIAFTGPHGKWSFPLVLFIPTSASAGSGPAPVFLYLNIGDRKRIDPTRQIQSDVWPAETLIARGYATAAFQVDDLSPNLNPSGDRIPQHDFRTSVHALFDPPLAPDSPRASDARGHHRRLGVGRQPRRRLPTN